MLLKINGKQTENISITERTMTKCRISENNHLGTIVFDCGIFGDCTMGNVVIKVDIVV